MKKRNAYLPQSGGSLNWEAPLWIGDRRFPWDLVPMEKIRGNTPALLTLALFHMDGSTAVFRTSWFCFFTTDFRYLWFCFLRRCSVLCNFVFFDSVPHPVALFLRECSLLCVFFATVFRAQTVRLSSLDPV